MKYYIACLLVCFIGCIDHLFAQTLKKGSDHVNGNAFNYYFTEVTVDVKGIVILLPAFGEKPQSIINKSALPKLLAEKGYVTVLPEIRNMLFADQYTLNEIDQLIKTQTERYHIANVIIGGLSSGGAIATGFAESALARGCDCKLKGLIVIDAPLDLQRIYESAERKIKYSCGGLVMKEGLSIKAQLDRDLGGSPANQMTQYSRYSCYLASSPDGGNVRYLKGIPIRFYTQPDLDFVKSKYCADLQFEDINATDLKSVSEFLIKNGNTKSEYIATVGKGFHSWNIIEPVDCTKWILDISK
jgi:pimeloyl-ACP methyl ester carboxylesterase